MKSEISRLFRDRPRSRLVSMPKGINRPETFADVLTMSLFATATTTQQSTTVDLTGDLEVPQGPDDSISEVAFSPVAEILSVASWDNKVRIYEIGQGGATGKAMYEHTGPVLSTHFSKDGSKLASGSADKTAKVFDLGSGQNQQVAAHDMPIKSVKFITVNGTEALATASWDKTLKYWDLRCMSLCLCVVNFSS